MNFTSCWMTCLLFLLPLHSFGKTLRLPNLQLVGAFWEYSLICIGYSTWMATDVEVRIVYLLLKLWQRPKEDEVIQSMDEQQGEAHGWLGGGAIGWNGRQSFNLRTPAFRQEFNEKQIYSRQPKTAHKPETNGTMSTQAKWWIVGGHHKSVGATSTFNLMSHDSSTLGVVWDVRLQYCFYWVIIIKINPPLHHNLTSYVLFCSVSLSYSPLAYPTTTQNRFYLSV